VDGDKHPPPLQERGHRRRRVFVKGVLQQSLGSNLYFRSEVSVAVDIRVNGFFRVYRGTIVHVKWKAGCAPHGTSSHRIIPASLFLTCWY